MIELLSGLIFFIILGTILMYINKYLNNDNYSLYFIFNLSWIIMISLYIMNFNDLPMISLFLKLYLSIYFIIVNLSYFIVRKLSISHISIRIEDSYNFNKKILSILFLLWIIFLLYFLMKVYTTIGFEKFFLSNAARKIIHELGKEYNINISYYIFGTYYLWGLTYLNVSRNERHKFKYIIVLSSLLLTAAKMNFVMAILGSIFIKYHYSNLSYKKILLLILPYIGGFLIFLVLFAIFTGKVVDSSVGSITSLEDIKNITFGVLLYPYTYLVSSLFALDYYVNHIINSNGYEIDYMFRYILLPLYKILAKFDLVNNVPSHILSFVYIDGFKTNVYSFFYVLFHDFGLIGSLFFGILSSWLFALFDFNIKFNKSFLLYLMYGYLAVGSFLSIISYRFNTTIFIGFLLFFASVYLYKGKLFVKNSI